MEEETVETCTDPTATNTQKSSILVQDETASTTITKDSGYSTSCNSQSQKSGSFKSKSTNSASSCESSRGGFHSSSNATSNREDNHLSGNNSENINSPEKIKCTRRHKKKKKLSTSSIENVSDEISHSTPMETNECDATTETLIVETIAEVNVNFSNESNKSATVEEAEMIDQSNVKINKIIANKTSSNKSVNKSNTTNKSTHQEIPITSPLNSSNIEEKAEKSNKAETDSTLSNFKEFNAIVSMKDGVVLYCTANLTDVLGFPSDMWLGRSFIDFVHPNDRKTFASHVASCVTAPDEEIQQQTSSSTSFFPNFTKHYRNTKRNYLYCCLRHYNSLFKNGYGITDKRVHYKPCQLIFSFKEIPIELSDTGMQKGMFLIINARTVNSIYKVPNEMISNADKVFIRHNNACQVNFVNDDIVPYFGYLPHRIIGNSIFNFYHPEDIGYIKNVYQELLNNNSNNKMNIQNKKPIRIRCQNGHYCVVETDWSAFTNPWTGQLEFIVGQHSVIQGPIQPDVCAILEAQETVHSHDEVMKQSKLIQEEINIMLNKTMLPQVKENTTKIHEPTKGLSSFMENLIENTNHLPLVSHQSDSKKELQPAENISERESIMLGEISPYHEYSDSKSSSETPPSYTQLNYDDNIQRFFESKPKTSPSDDSKSDETSKQSKKNKSDSSDLSGDNSGASSSNNFQVPGPSTSSRDQQHMYHRHPLTEESLTKHNADMEKKMVQKHKEQKLNTKHKHKHVNQDDNNTHGVKRSGSHSWENEPFKSAKQSYNHHHGTDMNSRLNYSREGTTRTSLRNPNPSTNLNLWPPFNVSNTMINSNNNMSTTLLPYLYIPNSNEAPKMQPGPSNLPGTPITGIPYVSPFVYPLPLPLPMYSPMIPMCSHLPLNHLPIQRQQQLQQTHQKVSAQQLSQQDAQRNVQNQIHPSNPSLDNSFTGDESSYHSSLYSLLKTDESSPDEDSTNPQNRPQDLPVKRKNTLQENIRLGLVRKYVNSDQAKYQLPERKLSDVLSQDLLVLAQLNQPDLVNVQLSQLYSELELEGLSSKLRFEGTENGFSSSSDGLESFTNTSSDENSSSNQQQTKSRKARKALNYDRLSRLYEENAPIPPPDVIVSSTTATTTSTSNEGTVINTTMVVIASC